jgi:FtsP/CotA-like multicopper oxidase with cupredoxin domain
MIDDWRLDNDGQIDQASFGGLHDWSHGGRLGNWLTINGKSAPEFRVKDKARIRLHLISAANARIMTFQLTDASATLIALDGAFCQPEQVTKITLAPAQRADVIVDMGRGSIEIAEISIGEPYPAATVLVDTALAPSSLSKTPINTPKPTALPSLNNLRRIPIHMQGGAMGNLQKAILKGQNCHFANWHNNTKSYGLLMARLEITRPFLPRLIKMNSYHLMSITIQHGAMQCIFMAIISGLCRMTRRLPFPQASATHGLCNRKSVSALFLRPTTPVYGCFIVIC